MSQPTPPRLATRVLQLVLRGDAGEAFRGDLEERFLDRATRDGIPAARRWYRAQSWSVARSLLQEGLTAKLMERRPGTARGAAHESTYLGVGDVASDWVRSVGFAARSLIRTPGFSIPALLLIGLGVGGVTTVFTLVDHVLLRSLPYPEAERLMRVGRGTSSGPVVQALVSETNAFDGWAAAYSGPTTLAGEGDPIQLETATVTEGFFHLFGGRAALGRVFIPDDFRAPEAAVVSHTAWVRVFGADPKLVGRSITVDGALFTVVGVLESDFEAPQALVSADVDVWRPIDWASPRNQRPDMSFLTPVGRVSPGVAESSAQADLDRLAETLASRFPQNMRDAEGVTEPLPMVPLQEATVQRVRAGLGLLMGAVGLLLLVACLNVAHLFLARGIERTNEIAVRRAVGANGGEILRQVLVESLVLGAGGGLLGVALAKAGLTSLVVLRPAAMPLSTAPSLDFRVLLFAGVVTIAAAVVFGALPCVRSLQTSLSQGLRSGSRRSTDGRGVGRLHGAMVVTEVALSVVLVAMTGLMARSYQALHDVPTGLVVEKLVTMPLAPKTASSPLPYHELMDGIVEAVESVPGVTSATYGLILPFEETGSGRCCWRNWGMIVNGTARPDVSVIQQPVHEGYFETLGISLVAGRSWARTTPDAQPIPTVLTERLAIAFFGSAGAAVGQTITWERGGMTMAVAGVAADTRQYGLDQEPPRMMYLPSWTAGYGFGRAHVAVRTSRALTSDLVQSLRASVWRAAPSLPVPTVRPMDDWIRGSTGGRRFAAVVLAAFGAVSLLLAAAGLYGTLVYRVGRNRRALGIRLALGASRTRVEVTTMASGLRLAAAGCVAGSLLAWGAGRVLSAYVPGLAGLDVGGVSLAAATMLATAALASWIPARRAGRSDPLQALQAE